MYICLCYGIKERDVTAAMNAGCINLQQLVKQLGFGTQCTKCIPTVQTMLTRYLDENTHTGQSNIIPIQQKRA